MAPEAEMKKGVNASNIHALQSSNFESFDHLFEVENNFIGEYYNKFGFNKISAKDKDVNDLKHLEREKFYFKYAIPLLQKFKINEKIDFFFDELSQSLKKTDGKTTTNSTNFKEIIHKILRLRAVDRLGDTKKDDRIITLTS